VTIVVSFVSTDHVQSAAQKVGLDQATTNAIVDHYSDASSPRSRPGCSSPR
jgi:hypothetical protein